MNGSNKKTILWNAHFQCFLCKFEKWRETGKWHMNSYLCFLAATDVGTHDAVWLCPWAAIFVVCDEESSAMLPFSNGQCVYVSLQSYSEEFMFLLLLCNM